MTCPNCHHEVTPNAPFCGNCGFKLINSQTASPAVESPTPAPNPPQVITPMGNPNPAVSNPTPTTINAAQPTVSVHNPMIQPTYAGAAGAVVGSMVTPAPTFNSITNTAVSNNPTQENNKAIAAFVLAVLGCVGWLIPIVGVILGTLALVFGTISLKSQRRVFAIIGIVLAVPVIAVSIFFWVYAAQHILKSRSKPTAGVATSSNISSNQTITSPCYSLKLPSSLTLTQTMGSCTFQASSTASGELYNVKVLSIPRLSAANLSSAAQADAKNIVNLAPGGVITNQQSGTFADSSAYVITLSASDGSAGTIDYIYKSTSQGNLVIVFHAQRSGKDYDLSTIEKDWTWQ